MSDSFAALLGRAIEQEDGEARRQLARVDPSELDARVLGEALEAACEARAKPIIRRIVRWIRERPSPELVPILARCVGLTPPDQRPVLAPALAAIEGPQAANLYLDVLEGMHDLQRGHYGAVVDAVTEQHLTSPRVLPRLLDHVQRTELSGLLARRLLTLLDKEVLLPRQLAPLADRLLAAHRHAEERQALVDIGLAAHGRKFGEHGTWTRPTVALWQEVCEWVGVRPKAQESSLDSPETPEDLTTHLERRVGWRMTAARPLTPLDEAGWHETLGDSSAEKACGVHQDWAWILWERFRLPEASGHIMLTRLNSARFAKGGPGDRFMVIADAFMEGWFAADELARVAGVEAEPRRAPFEGGESEDQPVSEAMERFMERGMQLGEVLERTPLADWVARRLADHLAWLEPREQRREVEASILDALASGALFWYAAHRFGGGPLAKLIAVAEEQGAFDEPKRPSLARVEAALAPLSYVPLEPAGEPPRSRWESCLSLWEELQCPSLPEHEVPFDADTGQPMRFVAQVRLDTLPAEIREQIGPLEGVALIALFMSERGGRGKVVTLSPDRLAALEDDAPDARLRRIALGEMADEPTAGQWALMQRPELFEGRQAAWDVETELGHWIEQTSGDLYAESKIGGSYCPVRGSLKLPGAGRAALVLQLAFEHGARLPDAGLVYVLAVEGPHGRPTFLVHSESA